MSNLYTEQENTWAAMISNCRITDEQIQWAVDIYEDELDADGIPTFAQIVAACNAQNPPFDLWFRDSTEQQQTFFDNAATEYYGNWKIVGIYDDNDNSGFYAVAIETGEYTSNGVENGIIFSTRGTEPTTVDQYFLDLVYTDANIINSDITAQEVKMYEYLDGEFATLIQEKGYSNLATVGHSLGGYLAFSAAAHIVNEEGYAAEIFMQGTNIDGPGVTEENLEANQDIYAKINPYLTHYHYTYIGALLTPICDRYISITGASDSQMFAESIPQEQYDNLCEILGEKTAYKMNAIYEYITGNKDKHALISLQFDDEGNFDVNGGWFENPTEVDSGFSNLVDANELTAGKIVGYTIAPALFYMTYIIYDIIYKESQGNPADVEFDILATLGDVATEIADKDDTFQIAVGGILDIICDGVMGSVKIYNDSKQLEEDLIDEVQLCADLDALSDSYRQVAADYLKAVVNPLEASTNWFELYSSVTELKATIDSIAVVNDTEVLAKDIFTNTANLYCNVYGTVFALAKESILNHHEMCLEIVVAGTETIINKVENWDTATKYVEAQKQLTSTWDSHSRQIQNMAEDFTDDSSELCADFMAYSKSTLNFMTEMVTYYAGNRAGNGSVDFSSALQEVKDAQQELLCGIKEVYTDGVTFLEEVGIAMKELVSDSFTFVHAWGEDEVKNIVLDWADSLYENLKSVDLEDVVSEWVLRGTDGYNDATDCVYGVSGDMQIHGTEKNDYLYGRKGDSELYGEGGNDTLFGGTGNDKLEGGAGQDTYCFDLGDGTDTIYDYESVLNSDKIVFGAGINPEDVTMERVDFDLIVKYSATDSFKVEGAYRVIEPEGLCFVESMEFADGTVWNTEDIANRANIHIGTDGDDFLEGYGQRYGYNTSETFYGGAGNDTIDAIDGDDTLYGDEGADRLLSGAGNDKLTGGVGNDELEGGAGQDTYYFNLGDGTDTIYDYESILNSDKIVFGAGINPEDVTMERVDFDLIVKYSAIDSFKVEGAYRVIEPEGLCFIESMEFADGTVWNTEDIAKRANIHIGTTGNDSMEGYGERFGYNPSETFYGGSGNDTITAGAGDDTLYGDEGTDHLLGGNDNDILAGGVGNDELEGGAGQDTYFFNLGDGTDTIYDYESILNSDKIVFGAGISPEDVTMERVDFDLVVKYSTTDSFTVENAYNSSNPEGLCFVELMEFADGTVWDTEDIANRANIHIGTENDDFMEGYGQRFGYNTSETFYGGAGNDDINADAGDDTLYGDEGADKLYGKAGNDTLTGGLGNDRMEGGAGQDTYCFKLGDGVDTVYDYESILSNDKIVFGEGISTQDVTMERVNFDLVVKYSATDSFTVKNAYNSSNPEGLNFVESIEFADGTVWDTEEIANRANIHIGTEGDDSMKGYGERFGYNTSETFHGGAGNDTINADAGNDTLYGDEGADTLKGGVGNDTLVGGAGNDYLEGGAGSDTYIIGANDGNDTIYNYDATETRVNDKIIYGEGIHVDDLSISKSGTGILITNNQTGQTTLIKQAYNTENKRLYNLEFYDNSLAVIDYSTLSLNITYAANEDITETVLPDEEISLQEEVTETSQEDGVSVVSEAEVNKMTDLMVQEMAGVSTDGTSQDITTDNTVVTESDTLLWTE